MKTIYLVRHAENPANITKEFSYRRVDYSLTEKGAEQARQTAEYFARLAAAGQVFDHIFASPLRRTRETAQAIAVKLGLPVVVEEALRELNVGRLETEGNLAENWRVHNSIMSHWRSGRGESRFPDGEDLHDLRERVRNVMELIVESTAKASIVVSHGGVIAYGLAGVVNPEGVDPAVELPNCAISRVVFPDRIPGRVEEWGRWDHLSGSAADLVSGVMVPRR